MPLENYGAIMGSAADNITQPLYRNHLLQQGDQRNAMEAQQQQFEQQKYGNALQKQHDDEVAWDQAYAAKDWGSMLKIDPQATQMLYAHEQGQQKLAQDQSQFSTKMTQDQSQFDATLGQRKSEQTAEQSYRNRQLAIESAKVAQGREGGSVPSGYRMKADGTGLEPIPGGPADKSNQPLDSRSAMMIGRILGSAQLGTKALENVVQLKTGATTGTLGIGGSPGHSVLQSTKDVLRNSIAPQDVQMYNVMISGIRRNLSQIETMGLAPSGEFSNSLASVELRDGDTELTKLSKLAETRQIIEEGTKSLLSDPRLPKAQRDQIQSLHDRLAKSVPYTQSDVIALSQADKPGTTLNDIIKARGLASKQYSPEEAAKLPSGTRFTGTDGVERVKH